MNADELNEPKLTLPYSLGGKDDPHFQDHIQPVIEQLPDSCLPPKDVLSHLGFETIDDHGGNWTPDRIESNEDWYESLRDEGRSDGEGLSYAERNV